jgi:hypothetical protein
MGCIRAAHAGKDLVSLAGKVQGSGLAYTGAGTGDENDGHNYSLFISD